MKRFIVGFLVLLILISLNNYAYAEDELKQAMEDAITLPESLNYTIDMETEQMLHLSAGKSPSGLLRVTFVDSVIKAIGINDYDYVITINRRLEESRGYTDNYPFYDFKHWDGATQTIAFELGIVFGDDNRNFRPFDKITCEEAVGIVMRCITNESKYDLSVLYEKAKEMEIIKVDDRFYDSPKDYISPEEAMILIYRLRQHEIIVPPITYALTNSYVKSVEREDLENDDIISMWNSKPLRRSFLYRVLLENYTFNKMSVTELKKLLGEYEMICTNESIMYKTYVLKRNEKKRESNIIEYTNEYIGATVKFDIIDGNVVGEPILIEHERGFLYTWYIDKGDQSSVTWEKSAVYVHWDR